MPSSIMHVDVIGMDSCERLRTLSSSR